MGQGARERRARGASGVPQPSYVLPSERLSAPLPAPAPRHRVRASSGSGVPRAVSAPSQEWGERSGWERELILFISNEEPRPLTKALRWGGAFPAPQSRAPRSCCAVPAVRRGVPRCPAVPGARRPSAPPERRCLPTRGSTAAFLLRNELLWSSDPGESCSHSAAPKRVSKLDEVA